MIELVPNWHPVWVHFTIGLLGGGVAFYLLSTIARSAVWGGRALAAANWCIGAGILFAVISLLTGWWAMNSVAHDDPAHANMLVHRNWAFGTAAVFVIAGIWMLARRRQTGPSFGVLALLLIAFGGLARTGYEGGQNVFEYGLGVQRLPETGGHDHGAHGHGSASAPGGQQENHAHAEGQTGEHDHGPAAAPAGAANETEHAHGEAPAVHEHEDQPAAQTDSGHDHAGHDHGSEPSPTPSAQAAVATGGLNDLAQALTDAIAGGDEAAIRRLLAADVLIFEGGGAERSLEEYAGHHMGSDMAFISAMKREVLERKAVTGETVGTVATRTRLTGTWKDREIDMVSSETLVFERRDGAWKVVHIHWSSDQ